MNATPSRTYAVGVPVVITVQDDGWITVEVDMSEAATAIYDDGAGPLDGSTGDATMDSTMISQWCQEHAVTGEGYARTDDDMAADAMSAPIVRDLPTGEVAEVSQIVPDDDASGWQVVYWGSRADYDADMAAGWPYDRATVSVAVDSLPAAMAELDGGPMS